MTTQARDSTCDLVVPKWLIKYIPLLDQPTKRLCHPDARDNMMLTLHKMDLELDILLGKPLGCLSGGEEDLIATDDGDSKQEYSHSPKLLAQLSSLARGKVSEEGTMSVKQLEELQQNIKKTKTRMGREIWG
ncbi:MAG: hypothetical protein LQ337_003434 [Flavoplaca oasis]|nr:MAG: hypothetical protein LQ337_003434 [Flavoplaca oasis]